MNPAGQWYCVHTKSHAEGTASLHLTRKHIDVLNPTIRSSRRLRRRVALFPSYIFARFAMPDQYERVRWTPGVKSIVGNGALPVPVDPEVIGYIAERAAVDGDDEGSAPRFVMGQRVRVLSGVFKELDGVFSVACPGQRRVRVLLELFRQQVIVELDADDLTA